MDYLEAVWKRMENQMMEEPLITSHVEARLWGADEGTIEEILGPTNESEEEKRLQREAGVKFGKGWEEFDYVLMAELYPNMTRREARDRFAREKEERCPQLLAAWKKHTIRPLYPEEKPKKVYTQADFIVPYGKRVSLMDRARAEYSGFQIIPRIGG